MALYFSAAHKSSGKTVITTGIARALTQQGKQVNCFKKGPDYIDPHWLASATGNACWNLDFNTQSDQQIKALLANKSADAGLVLVEGNKGLHDGTAVDGSNSNAAMAKLLQTPVVLVIDTRGMTRGVAPLLLGMNQFDPDVNIAGVILNQVGGRRHEGKLRSVIEQYTDIPVLGAVQKNPALAIDERHLGLIPSNEAEDAENFIRSAATAASDQIDLDRLCALAEQDTSASGNPQTKPESDITVAIAKDEAFGFYYADDLEAFEQAGARLIFFDALKDTQLPECDGMFIGGGFPETRIDALSANVSLRQSIRRAIESGLPAYAECGGLMYLSESIRWKERQAEMVGIIPGRTELQKRPVGRGYVRLGIQQDHPWGAWRDDEIQAHEFHHSNLTLTAGSPARFAYNVARGHGIDGDNDGIVVHNLLANYTHLRATPSNPWVAQFCQFIRQTAVHWSPQ